MDRLVDFASLFGLALVLAVMIAANPAVASVLGLDLLLLPALSLVLVTEAQMFVVGGGEIDLGVGAFAGFVSVLGATLLYDRPAWGCWRSPWLSEPTRCSARSSGAVEIRPSS